MAKLIVFGWRANGQRRYGVGYYWPGSDTSSDFRSACFWLGADGD